MLRKKSILKAIGAAEESSLVPSRLFAWRGEKSAGHETRKKVGWLAILKAIGAAEESGLARETSPRPIRVRELTIQRWNLEMLNGRRHPKR